MFLDIIYSQRLVFIKKMMVKAEDSSELKSVFLLDINIYHSLNNYTHHSN